MRVPFYRPALPPYGKIEPDFREAYQSGMLAPGKYTTRLKEALQDYLKVKHAILFSNCSDATICLCGYIKSLTGKNEIIIPSFTFAATWQGVDWNGMTSVVCDVEFQSGLLSPSEVDSYLTSHPGKVAAILAVHVFGQPAYVEELRELALKHKTLLIFDAAHGIGSSLNGKPLGDSGFAEVFSIGTTKTLAAGEGGFITTSDDQLAEAMYRASMHGHKYGELDVEVKSLNGRIQEINSIIAYHGLEGLGDVITERQNLALKYKDALEGIAEYKPFKCCLVPIIPRQGVRSSFKDYTCILHHSVSCKNGAWCGGRDGLACWLEDRGVSVKKYYTPGISQLDVLSRPNECGGQMIVHSSKNGNALAADCLSLPFFNGMTEEQFNYVIETLYSWARR